MATEIKTSVVRVFNPNHTQTNEFYLRASQSVANNFQDNNVLCSEYKGESGLYINVFESFGIQDVNNVKAVHITLDDRNRETKAENRYKFTVNFGEVVFDASQFSLVNCANISDDLSVSLGDLSDVENLDIVLRLMVILK